VKNLQNFLQVQDKVWGGDTQQLHLRKIATQ